MVKANITIIGRRIGKSKKANLAGLVVLLIVLSFGLSACNDISPNQVDSSVKTAEAISGSTPAPTVVLPDNGIGIDVVILGARTYYPDNPGESVGLSIYNSNNKTFYLQTCQGIVLQRQDATTGQWVDVAPDVPCPSLGPQVYAVNPNSSTSAPFVFKRTIPFRGQKMDTPGTYHLTLTYYVDCAPGSNSPQDCVGKRTVSTVDFQIQSGTTVVISTAKPAGPTPAATPKS